MFNYPGKESIITHKHNPGGKEIVGEFYDETYFDGKGKSSWEKPYTWKHFGNFFNDIAKFLVEGFPLHKDILDVGCAKGFLVKALSDTREENEMPHNVKGFDISEYAITNCPKDVAGKLKAVSLDEYQFEEDFDLMIVSETFEHLTEQQITDWLIKSRLHIRDSVFATIPLSDNPDSFKEPSHISVHSRDWWHEKFLSCGWQQPWSAKEQQKLAMEHPIVKGTKWNVFIYRSGNGKFDYKGN